MEHLGALMVVGFSPGRPGGFSGHRPTDERQIRDQEQADRPVRQRPRQVQCEATDGYDRSSRPVSMPRRRRTVSEAVVINGSGLRQRKLLKGTLH
jgi:hypothetical protein